MEYDGDKKYPGIVGDKCVSKNGKFVEHYEWLREAARQQEIRLDLCDNAMLHAIYGMESDEAKLASYSFIIFGTKTYVWQNGWSVIVKNGGSRSLTRLRRLRLVTIRVKLFGC